MARFRVEFITKGFVKKQEALIRKMAEKDLEAAARATAQVMKFNIQTSIERDGSTGNLAKNIEAEKILNGWGVGNIQQLNERAPYWYWINYGIAQSGRRVPPPTSGHFVPKDKGRLNQSEPFYKIVPEKPITPHNYIERTVQQIRTILNGIFRSGRKL